MSDKLLYYSGGNSVWCKPVKSARGTTLGFPVCTVADGVDVEQLVKILNRKDPPVPMFSHTGVAVSTEYWETLEILKRVAVGLDKVFNGDLEGVDRTTGFVLMAFPAGDVGVCNYVSNGVDRQDIIALLKEQVVRLEGQPLVRGSA